MSPRLRVPRLRVALRQAMKVELLQAMASSTQGPPRLREIPCLVLGVAGASAPHNDHVLICFSILPCRGSTSSNGCGLLCLVDLLDPWRQVLWRTQWFRFCSG